MADILGIIKGNQQKISLDKLAALCSKKNVWYHFDMRRNFFFELSDKKQRQLTSKFYFNCTSYQPTLDERISDEIKKTDGLNLTKVQETENNRNEMSVFTETKDEKKPKSLTFWAEGGFLMENAAISTLKKPIYLKIPFFTLTRGIKVIKIGKSDITMISISSLRSCRSHINQKMSIRLNAKPMKLKY